MREVSFISGLAQTDCNDISLYEAIRILMETHQNVQRQIQMFNEQFCYVIFGLLVLYVGRQD